MPLGAYHDEIESVALRLLRKESKEDQYRLMLEADRQLLQWGIDAHFHPSKEDPVGSSFQFVSDLVNAPGLKSVCNSLGVNLENVLEAENFEDLLDRLIPANPDR